jgi:DNA-binding beta-propeller fold protein YncE
MTPRLEARPTAIDGQSRRSVLTAIVVGACLLLSRGASAAGQDAKGPGFVKVIGAVPECGLLNQPMGIAISPVEPHDIYVIDAGNARIQAFRNVGRPSIGCWGSRGEAGHQFWRPRDLAFSPKGDFIYVVDSGAGIIKQFQPEKICFNSNDPGCRNLPSLSWGGIGSGPGTFQEASGVAVDSRGLVYVADAGRSDVQVFDENGTPVKDRVIGGPGNKRDDLRRPRDLDVGPEGKIWVADTGNDRIAIFDRKGEYLKSLNNGVDGFWNPSGISVAPSGAFIVRDFDPSYRTPRLWLFNAEGRRTGGPIALDGRDEDSIYYQQGVDFMPDGTAVLAAGHSWTGARAVLRTARSGHRRSLAGGLRPGQPTRSGAGC